MNTENRNNEIEANVNDGAFTAAADNASENLSLEFSSAKSAASSASSDRSTNHGFAESQGTQLEITPINRISEGSQHRGVNSMGGEGSRIGELGELRHGGKPNSIEGRNPDKDSAFGPGALDRRGPNVIPDREGQSLGRLAPSEGGRTAEQNARNARDGEAPSHGETKPERGKKEADAREMLDGAKERGSIDSNIAKELMDLAKHNPEKLEQLRDSGILDKILRDDAQGHQKLEKFNGGLSPFRGEKPNPDKLGNGGKLNPDKFDHGGKLNPDKFDLGGKLNPDKFDLGGKLNPDKFDHGGKLNPDKFDHGGKLNPEKFDHGGKPNAEFHKPERLHRLPEGGRPNSQADADKLDTSVPNADGAGSREGFKKPQPNRRDSEGFVPNAESRPGQRESRTLPMIQLIGQDANLDK